MGHKIVTVLSALNHLKQLKKFEDAVPAKTAEIEMKRLKSLVSAYEKITRAFEEHYFSKLDSTSPEDPRIIAAERYQELVDTEHKFQTLQSFGVDNWCGYADAMEDYRESKKEQGNG